MPIPVLLFISTAKFSLPESFDWGFLFAFYLAVFLVFVIAVLVSKYLFNYDHKGQSAYGVGAAYSNTTIVGIPVCMQALGPGSMLPLFIIIAIQSLFIFSIGILVAERKEGRRGSLLRYLLGILFQVFKSPITAGLFFGLLINLLGISFFPMLDEVLLMISGAAIPLALFVLGASLNNFNLLGRLSVVMVLVLLKSIVLPALVFLMATYLFQVDSLWAATAIIAAAMPIGVSAYAYAKKYQVCEEEVASGIFVSTLCSLLSISLLLGFLI